MPQDGDFFKPDSGKSKDVRVVVLVQAGTQSNLKFYMEELREKRAKESLKKGVARRAVECWALASGAAAREVAGAQSS